MDNSVFALLNYAQDDVYDKFLAALVVAVKALKIGPGNVAGNTCGPLINEAGADKVAAHCDDAVSKGATIHCGGHRMRAKIR